MFIEITVQFISYSSTHTVKKNLKFGTPHTDYASFILGSKPCTTFILYCCGLRKYNLSRQPSVHSTIQFGLRI